MVQVRVSGTTGSTDFDVGLPGPAADHAVAELAGDDDTVGGPDRPGQTNCCGQREQRRAGAGGPDEIVVALQGFHAGHYALAASCLPIGFCRFDALGISASQGRSQRQIPWRRGSVPIFDWIQVRALAPGYAITYPTALGFCTVVP